MRIPFPRLEQHLAAGALPRVILVAGDEPFLNSEACDLIRKAARARGHSERERIPTDGSDWMQALRHTLQSCPLLPGKRLVEADLRSTRLTQSLATALTDSLPAIPDDMLLLLVGGASNPPPAWHRACETAGLLVATALPKGTAFLQWIRDRAARMPLALPPQGAETIAEWTEGNLAAAAQALDTLALADGDPGQLSKERLKELLADNARHDPFQLADALKARDTARARRILKRLWLAGTEPTLALWACARTLRTGPYASTLLPLAAHIDRAIKGASQGDTFDALDALICAMTGKPPSHLPALLEEAMK